jgi:hypothetical protein
MRSLAMLILVASIGLLGVAIWEGLQWYPGQTLQAASARFPVRPPVKKKEKAVHGGMAKNPVRSPDSGTNEPPSFPPHLNSGAAVVRHPLSVPDSDNMEIGATRSELRERYGVPTFAVESVRDGSLVERYYYVKPDHANVVMATLHNGKLVAAQNARLSQLRQAYAAQLAQQ